MDREQKAAQIEEMKASLTDAEAIFAVDYRGISVPQAAELRSRLRDADASFRIVKNRLAKLAAADAGTDELTELLEGPTALTFVKGDPLIAAKAIATFRREHEILEFKGGLMEGAPLDPEQFQAIARLPALEVLHGRLVGVTASPITGLARGLGAMLSGLTIALGQIQEQGLLAGEAEVEEESAEEEAPPEEAAEEEAPAEDEAPAEEEEAPAAEESPAEQEAPAEAPEAEEKTDEPEAEADEGGDPADQTETEEESKED